MLPCSTHHHDDWRRRRQIILVVILLALFASVLWFAHSVATISPVTLATGTFVTAGVGAAAYAVKAFFPYLQQCLVGTSASKG